MCRALPKFLSDRVHRWSLRRALNRYTRKIAVLCGMGPLRHDPWLSSHEERSGRVLLLKNSVSLFIFFRVRSCRWCITSCKVAPCCDARADGVVLCSLRPRGPQCD